MGRPAAKTGKWLAAGLGCAGLFLLCGTLVFLLGRGSVPAGPAAPPFVAIEPGSGETDPSTAGTTASSAAASYPSVQPSGDPAREFTFPEEGRAALDTLLAGYEGVSVFYQDVGSGAVYEYRSLEKYPAASVVKAPYCLYVLDLASQGRADLNQTFTYTEQWMRKGTGKIQNMPFGTVLTLRELVRYAIEESD